MMKQTKLFPDSHDPKNKKAAHDDSTLSTMTEHKNCVVHSWPCGCKTVLYKNSNKVMQYFCNTGGRQEAEIMIKNAKEENKKEAAATK